MSDIISIHPSLLNLEKTDSHIANLFFGQPLGLMDTINVHYPQLERLYKKVKSLDWDETEFDFEPCRIEFLKMGSVMAQPMIRQIGWQWETDSMVARMLAQIMGVFLTDGPASDLYLEIARQEIIHGRTYGEIVKFSFDDPNVVMSEIMEIKEHRQRLVTVAKVFREAYIASHELALGIRKRDQETFEIFVRFVFALFLTERGSFMNSFPITFSYGEGDMLMPICKAVQKICQDEYESHALAGAYLLDIIMSTGEGITAMYNNRNLFSTMLHELHAVEKNNFDFLLCGQDRLFDKPLRDFERWVDSCFGDIAKFVGIQTQFEVPKGNPLPWMKNWVNISNIQAALQEEKNGAYLLGMVKRDDRDMKFEDYGMPGLLQN